ncbi:MAG TPA: methyltransferase domain-containing protein [Terriglobia bacterium]|nr:methyltransferase domain-containing protein [Terriglobia bacterium]
MWLPLAALELAAGTLACSRLAGQNSGPERDAWQHPEQVMDALGVKPGSAVADVGCGRGYFTFHLASRVGPNGKVYAEDLQDDKIAEIRRQAKEKGLTQIEAIAGTPDDPHLPTGALDAVLIVDAYHEMHEYDAMLAAIYRALKPGGMLTLIDGKAEPGKSREDYYSRHRMPEEIERQDAERNGFRLLRQEPGFARPEPRKEYYFLIFQKPLS